MTTRPDPVRLPVLAPHDADHERLRLLALTVVTAAGGEEWTDHNPTDPGVTLLDAVAWAWADAHYRAARRGLDHWPDAALRAPSPRPGPDGLLALARLLASTASGPAGATGASTAVALAKETRTGTRGQAQEAVAARARAAGLTVSPEATDLGVGVVRGPLLRRRTLDRSDVVAAAVEEAAAGLPTTATDAQKDLAATRLLGDHADLAMLFHDELADLLRRERARTSRLASRRRAEALRGPGDDPLHDPDTWEGPAGVTTVWPPTPDQALRCEPVTADDYATRARGAAEVRRAWTVAGALPGIAWHGGRTVVTDRPGTVTVLVERTLRRSSGRDDEDFLRRVLDHVLREQASRYAGEGRRRVLGEELGVALVRHHPVAVSGVLHTALGVDREEVVARARTRLAAYLTDGRAESRRPDGPLGPGRGPWPSRPQPHGWTPGEAVPVTELVQVLAADPLVLGVGEVSATVKDGPSVKAPVRVRSTASLPRRTLAAVDGVTLAAGNRVLLTAQDHPEDNGVWVAATGDWTRADDLACSDCVTDVVLTVLEGTAVGTSWAQLSDPPLELGRDPLVWEQTTRRVLPDVRVVLTAPAALAGQPQLSGVWLFAGERVLVTAQADAATNGVYEVRAGAWARVTGTAVPDTAVHVAEGADAGSTWWLATRPPLTVGTTPQHWARTAAPQPAPGDAADEVRLPAGGLPVLAGTDCLTVRYELTAEADDA